MYVVSDVHGDYTGLTIALESAGLIIDKPGRGLVKKRGEFVLQIGDLANCVYDSIESDLKCLDKVGSDNWIDAMLIGNHEIPYFDPGSPFAGFHFNARVNEKLWELYDNGLLLASMVSNLGRDKPALISHAGISQKQLNLGTGTTAQEVYSKLEQEWFGKNFSHYLFRDCGRARYGPNEIGGVLWCDFDKEFEPTDFPQIVGHTSGVLRSKGNALCIDTQRTNNGVPTVIKLEV
jgi:hypothetical protein